ncbi:MAG: imidazoleglycerol-phosphate dehydratase HisB [bacterium]
MVESERKATVNRETRETRISVVLDLDGKGDARIKTPYGFLDHMVGSLAMHGHLDLSVSAAGDTEVDAHHTVEDLGLALGQALYEALGDKEGIARFGQAMVPMDDSLATAVIDLSGRPYLVYDVHIPERERWEFDVNLVKEFFQALTNEGRMNLHIILNYGSNYHHACEALFKAAGRAISQAVSRDVEGLLSTKGTLA